MEKKLRYADRLSGLDADQRVRDVHLLIGGTGAVGGETLIKMLRVYADMRRLHGIDPAANGPVLVATGHSPSELVRFRKRLGTLAQAEFGERPSKRGDTIRMPTGALVVLCEFSFGVLPRLNRAIRGGEVALADYLADVSGEKMSLLAALQGEIERDAPLTDLLTSVRENLKSHWPFKNFRSAQIGIPIPSLLAYHTSDIRMLFERGLLSQEEAEEIKDSISRRLTGELSEVRRQADAVIVAHTTAVGGMYDVTEDGTRRIRLGFAHAAIDARLTDKQRHAESISGMYAKAGIWNLVTAAAIGIDYVGINEPLRMAKEMGEALRHAAEEPFPGARNARYVHVHPPVSVPLRPPARPERLSFERMPRGGELRPRLALRSGENGYLSAANAEALYRTMRVASPSELGAVLAIVGALGDDPNAPWFPCGEDGRRECYYKESDNSRLVFDFLSQPQVRSTQLSGMEPQALVDLGSAKHQAELHTLGLLILLHRLRTLDLDAIPALVEPRRFDAVSFFENNSRPLSFEDIQEWDVVNLERDLRTLVMADHPGDLAPLKEFRAKDQDRLAPNRAAARELVFSAVLSSVRAVTSLGSPIVVDDGSGNAIVRCSWWVAPLLIAAESTSSIAGWFSDRQTKLAADGVEVPLDDLIAHHFAVNGFIDLRQPAIIAATKTDESLSGRIWRTSSPAELRRLLQGLTPYEFFASCGLLALLERLKGLANYLQVAQMELGTHFDGAWAMPRDEHGHTLVVPGIVEAFRMVSEGLEKGTGTEILDGYWGYYPTPLLVP